jgi:hypothetical protein
VEFPSPPRARDSTFLHKASAGKLKFRNACSLRQQQFRGNKKPKGSLNSLIYKKPLLSSRFFIYDFFVFLQDKSSGDIFTKEFGKCNVPET